MLRTFDRGDVCSREWISKRIEERQDEGFVVRIQMKKIINYSEEADSLNNIVYIPDKGNADISELPLLVYLHGAGERGSNLGHLSRNAIPRLIDNGSEYPAVVLCPQCPADVVWDNIPAKIK